MIVDLHIHTNRSSDCSSLHPPEILDGARQLGIDAVAVTEHSVTRGALLRGLPSRARGGKKNRA
jgi:predicted metal-dependent phosphoesterase TrpH